MLYSQLAYRVETVHVGGGADEVGGPLRMSDSKWECVRARGPLRSKGLEGGETGDDCFSHPWEADIAQYAVIQTSILAVMDN